MIERAERAPLDDLMVLLNPTAGGGRAAGVWRRLLARRPELGSVPLIDGTRREAAGAALRANLTSLAAGGGPPRRLLVVGGDGTLNLAASLVLELGLGGRVALGLVAAGTGCDLARSLGLPMDPPRCLDHLLAAVPRPLDALRLELADGRRRFVVNVTSAGISGLVAAAVNARPRRGKSAFLTATLGAMARYRPPRCRVTADGEPFYEGEIYLLAVANGPTFGRNMKIAPSAELDDGAAEVVLVEPMPPWELPFRLAQLYRGSHLGARPVRHRRATRVRLEPLEPFPALDLDGETLPDPTATDITLLPGALRVLA